ncbi:hypothetical protein MRX96_000410 [Rhipicephalus microplus]
MSLPVAGLISVLETHLDPSFWVLQVSRLSWVSRQPRTTSALHRICHRRVDGYVGFSGATMEPLEFCLEALEIAHRRQRAEVETARWPERGPAFGRKSC